MPDARRDETGGGRLLTWEAWAHGVDWGMVVFIAGVLALGASLGAPATGIPAFFERDIQPMVSGLPEYVFVFALVVTVLTVTAVISNLVTVVAVVPPAVAMSLALNVGRSGCARCDPHDVRQSGLRTAIRNNHQRHRRRHRMDSAREDGAGRGPPVVDSSLHPDAPGLSGGEVPSKLIWPAATTARSASADRRVVHGGVFVGDAAPQSRRRVT